MKLYLVLGLMAVGKITLATRFDGDIERISREYGNDPNLVKALIKIESNFNPDAHRSDSREDSRGLGQINAPTARALGRSPERCFEPVYNIETMNLLLIDIKIRFTELQDIIATYNAGTVRKNADGVYKNNSYVVNVLARFWLYKLSNVVTDTAGGVLS